MKILYLYAEVMSYTMATIREFVKFGHELYIVHWDHKKLTPYMPPLLPNVHFYNRSELTVKQLKILANNILPDLVVVSGWMDRTYMSVAKYLRQRDIPVVLGLDSQWYGTGKQWIATILGKMHYFTSYFSHAWVAGIYQYEYARKLGFSKKCIIYDLYSADCKIFNQSYNDSIRNKANRYPHRFLFVGRFETAKGLDVLLRAWQQLDKEKNDWELCLIGCGTLKAKLESINGVVVKDFMQPEELIREVAEAGCFVLPSRYEPWGVVVHEFAAAGLPIIVSDVVGSACTFLIPGLNGFSFKSNNAEDLAKRMRQIINMSDQELYAMAVCSHELSQRITPKTSAANLLSIVN